MKLALHAGDGGKKARLTREITKEAVKTIAQGMPDRSGGPVVTNSCAFYLCARGCGCADAPAFPAPSFSGEHLVHHPGVFAPRECGLTPYAV
jgi:hypothetical protein